MQLPCDLIPVVDLAEAIATQAFDAICLVNKNSTPGQFAAFFENARQCDAVFDKDVSCFQVNGIRIVYAPIGDLDDFDDVRVYERAGAKAIARAIKAGAKKPLIILPNPADGAPRRLQNASLLTMMGALNQLYTVSVGCCSSNFLYNHSSILQPIQYREDVSDKKHQIQALGVYAEDDVIRNECIAAALRIEQARLVARDIGGGDPERMSPPNAAQYVIQHFSSHTHIKIRVIDCVDEFQRKYPLFAAVNRAAAAVPRHNGRIVFLEYIPTAKPLRKTLILVGKGVTYDTGGADIKAGGVMAGMSRDKCGAAAVAGFMQYVAGLQPTDVAVIGVLCLVRNSVGEECYVSDEIITAASGVRVRVGNTDAEGRMCMADALYEVSGPQQSLPVNLR